MAQQESVTEAMRCGEEQGETLNLFQCVSIEVDMQEWVGCVVLYQAVRELGLDISYGWWRELCGLL